MTRLAKRLWWELPLAMLIAKLLGDFSIATVLAGFAIIALFEVTIVGLRRGTLHPTHVFRYIHFAWNFVVDLTVSNILLAVDVVTPRDYHQIHMVEVSVDDLSPGEIALLCHRITLTPGTLACEVFDDRKVILVHAMYPEKDMRKSLRRPIDILRGDL